MEKTDELFLDCFVESLEESVNRGIITEFQAGKLRSLYLRIIKEKIKGIIK